MSATTTQLLSSGEFCKLRYDTIPVKSASANLSFCTNNSKMPDFELWHSCRKWAICGREYALCWESTASYQHAVLKSFDSWNKFLSEHFFCSGFRFVCTSLNLHIWCLDDLSLFRFHQHCKPLRATCHKIDLRRNGKFLLISVRYFWYWTAGSLSLIKVKSNVFPTDAMKTYTRWQ